MTSNIPSSHTREGQFDLLVINFFLYHSRFRSTPRGRGDMATFDFMFNRRHRKKATVRRENIAQDGYDQLSSMGAELKGPVEIQFIDQFGQEE